MKSLKNVAEVTELIHQNKLLLLAGPANLLSSLPRGSWIGGTIPYFMSENGGLKTHDKIQVVELPPEVSLHKIANYSSDEMSHIPADYPLNGASIILLPAFSEAHSNFSKNCAGFPGLFNSPLLGWVTGFDLDTSDNQAAVYNGLTLQSSSDKAVVMHFSLPPNLYAKIGILNLFEPGNGDEITFLQDGFEIEDCVINNQKTNLFSYLTEKKIDTQLPLVANYAGARINVSIKNMDAQQKKVSLYAPVFSGVSYKIAYPVQDYESSFAQASTTLGISKPIFSCNCILNYLYAHLEGKKTADIVGPMTFGEIAYMLLNQTMVYMTFEKK